MDIIIIGAGQVGSTLSAQLTKEDHNVTIIDNDAEIINDMAARQNVIAVHGNGASYALLEEARAQQMDMLIATTGSDEINMLCCVLAKKLGIQNNIARVRDPQYRKQVSVLKDELGLSFAINPERAAANEIARILNFPSAIKVKPFANGNAEMVEFRIPRESKLHNMALSRLHRNFAAKVLVCAVQRGNEIFIPSGDFVLHGGDRMTIVAALKDVRSFFKESSSLKSNLRDVMIIGGGRITVYLAQQLLHSGLRVKIIERDEARCQEISAMLPKAHVSCGNGSRQDVLQEEGLKSTDAFVALTNSDKSNIILSMYAQTQGVEKVAAKVDDQYYTDLLTQMGVDSIILPKRITAQRILQYVRTIENSRGSNVKTLYYIADGQVEAVEFNVEAGARCLDIELKNLDIRKSILIAAIIRNGECIIPSGSDVIKENDSVIIVTSRYHLIDLDDILQ